MDTKPEITMEYGITLVTILLLDFVSIYLIYQRKTQLYHIGKHIGCEIGNSSNFLVSVQFMRGQTNGKKTGVVGGCFANHIICTYTTATR